MPVFSPLRSFAREPPESCANRPEVLLSTAENMPRQVCGVWLGTGAVRLAERGEQPL